MKVSDTFFRFILYFFFIFCGLGTVVIFILEHGLAEAWLDLQEKDFRLFIGIAILIAGIAGIFFEIIPNWFIDRKRDAFKKRFAERYK